MLELGRWKYCDLECGRRQLTIFLFILMVYLLALPCRSQKELFHSFAGHGSVSKCRLFLVLCVPYITTLLLVQAQVYSISVCFCN